MSFFLRPRTTPEGVPMPAPIPSRGAQFGAGFRAQQIEDDAFWRERGDRQALLNEVIEQLGGRDVFDPAREWVENPPGAQPGWQPQSFEDWAAERVMSLAGEAAAREPGAWANLPHSSLDAFNETLRARRRAEWDRAQQIMARGDNGATQVAGQFAGAAVNEANLTLSLMGGPVGAGARGALGFVGREMALGAGAEALILPRAMDVADELDLPAPDPLTRLAMGAAIGGVFGVVGVTGSRMIDYFAARNVAEAALRPEGVAGNEYSDAVRAAEAALRTGQIDMSPVGMAATQRGQIDTAATTLLGVTGRGDQAAALVLLPDGTRVSNLRIGDTLPDGARITAMGDGEITIDRNGQISRVRVTEAIDGGASPGAAQPASTPVASDTPPARVPNPEIPPLDDPVVLDVLGLIQQIEAAQGFNQVSGYARIDPERPITTMTVNQVLDWQRRNIAAGAQSVAAGGFQIINRTLRSLVDDMNLTGNEVFDEAMQRAMAVQLMRRRGLDDWRAGRISDTQFANNLAQEWAALPIVSGPRAGRSYYAGDGLNASRTTPQTILAALRGQGAAPRPRSAGGGSSGVDAAPDPRRPGMTRNDEVVSPTGQRVEVEYEVVDLSALQRATGDLQPRDRSRSGSDEQIAEIAARLDPARLMPSPEGDRGAPIVGADNIVESGNGRVAAIRRAADLHPDRYDAYVARIRAEGFAIPEGVARPVLVARRRSELSPEQRREWVRGNNTSAIARMAGGEQARLDSTFLSQHAFDAYRPRKSLASLENAEFVRRAMAGFPQAERNALFGATGQINPDGLRRMRLALFARAWDADDLLRLLTEAPSPELRALIDMMEELAPDWAAFRAAIDAGLVRPEFDITGQVVGVVRTIGKSRTDDRQGQSVVAAIRDYLDQGDMFAAADEAMNSALLTAFYRGDRARQPAAVGDILGRYIDDAQIVGRADADDLFAAPPSPRDVLVRATEAHEAREARAAPPGQRSEPPAPEPAPPASDLTEGASSPALVRLADDTEAEVRRAINEQAAPNDSTASQGLDANERPAENTLRDRAGLRELGRLVEQGADRDVIDSHPVVVQALAELDERARQATNLSDGFNTQGWHEARVYTFGPDRVTGTEAALPRWVEDAEGFAGGKVNRSREAIIVLGPPAAGKSTIAEDLALARGAAILDSDEIKKTLPEFEGGIGAARVHEESSLLSDLVEAELRSQGTNVVFPKVGGTPGSIRAAIDRFKADGYSVEIVNMAVTTENAYRRMIGRFVKTGRIIPPKYVDYVGESPSATYRTLKEDGKADGFAEIDNNGGFGQPKPITDQSGANPFRGSSLDISARGRERDVLAGQPLPPRDGGEASPPKTGQVNTERTAAGEQVLIPGVAPITDTDRLTARAARPLDGGSRRSDTEIGGLFDPNDPARVDLFDAPPSPAPAAREADQVVIDAADYATLRDIEFTLDGGEGAPKMRLRDVLDDLEADATMADAVRICTTGGRT